MFFSSKHKAMGYFCRNHLINKNNNMSKQFIQFFGIVLVFVSLISCEKEELLEMQEDSKLSKEIKYNDLAPRVLINGEPLQYMAPTSFQESYNDNSVVMVPLNAIFTALDWDISWDAVSKQIIVKKENITIKLQIGNTNIEVSGTEYQLQRAPKIVNNRTMVPVRLLEYTGARVEWDHESKSVQIYYWDKLDYGIYFYDSEKGSEGDWDAVGCQKYIEGQSNRFFDPSKPTIIYVHGFQLGGVKNKAREGFHLNQFGANIHTQNFWKEAGYNVAIFHWVQFADDGFLPPDNVEVKIYDSEDLVGMRWKKPDGSFVLHDQGKTMAELFSDEYRKVFNNSYTGNRIHLIGNSLGGNLVMAGTLKLYEYGQSKNLMPKRITLIDPYWSQNKLYGASGRLPYGAFDTKDFGGISAEILYNNYDIAIEYYRTSLAGMQGSSERAIRQAAFTHLGTEYTNITGIVDKHTLPVRQYLWSGKYNPPNEVYRNFIWQDFTITGKNAGSASTPDFRIKEMMGKSNNNYRHWNHIEGRNTIDPSDDSFAIKNGQF